jgi:hypothetical protein
MGGVGIRPIACLLLLLLATQAVHAQGLEPGRWRVITTTLTGPPAPPEVASRCLTPEEAADPGKTFGPQISTVNSLCERTEFKLEPSGLTWKLQCKGQVDMDVAGQFVFESATRYSAMLVTRTTVLERIVQNTLVSITAERVGACQ